MLCFVGVEWNRMDEIKEINENWREDFEKKRGSAKLFGKEL